MNVKPRWELHCIDAVSFQHRVGKESIFSYLVRHRTYIAIPLTRGLLILPQIKVITIMIMMMTMIMITMVSIMMNNDNDLE